MSWTTIESEPAVFYELIKEFGVQGVQVEELWSLDKESLEALRPVYGLVFLFKWTAEKDSRPVAPDTLGKVFFAKQVIQNACATQAILSVLLNTQGLELGPQLQQLKDFTADFPPEMKGEAIGNSDSIRLAHNSFARPEPLVPDEKDDSKDSEAFHFISYLPVDGTLYELDGLKEGPIPLCTCSDGDWLEKVVPHIQDRMAHYTEKEVRFNVMAIVRDRLTMLQEKVKLYEDQRQMALHQLDGTSAAGTETEAETAAAAAPMDVDPAPKPSENPAPAAGGEGAEGGGEVAGSPGVGGEAGRGSRVLALDAELAALRQEIQEEQDKRQRWHEENVRRRHNYVPFLFHMLRLLAERGQLTPLVERAHTLAKEKQEQQRAQGKQA